MPLQRGAPLYCDNTVTVDSGAGINIRGLDETLGANDATQSIQNTNQGTAANRTFYPTLSTAADVSAAELHRRGWAIPLTEMEPADARCVTVLPAQNISFGFAGTWSGTGSGNVGQVDAFTPRVALWKYDPATDAGTLIATGTGTEITHSAAFAYTSDPYTATASAAIPETVFAAGEVLLMQVGGVLACGSGLLGAARSTSLNLNIGIATVRLTLATSGLRQKCSESAVAAVSLAGSLGVGSQRRRTFTGSLALTGTYVRSLVLHRHLIGSLALLGAVVEATTYRRAWSASIALAGAVARKIIPAPKVGSVSLTGVRQPWTIRLGRADLKGALGLTGVFAKGLRKQVTGQVHLNAAYQRALTFRRTFTGQVTMTASWLVKLPQAVLNRMSGGTTTVIRRIIKIFED